MDEHPAALTRFDVAIIDPPWPIEKLDRDVRPNQAEVDYATMDADALRAFADEEVRAIAGDACHLFMWTTQKFLPLALELVERAGFTYCVTMVWHKSGGFQPVGLPQYNCEFVVYARKGAPAFVDTEDFPCCFGGQRREHSRRPVEFFHLIRRVTAGRCIDMCAREPREGFDLWGDETAMAARGHG